MARTLITGASGFIGQHLCLALAAAGWNVCGLSRSPRPGHLSGIDWISCDILDARVVARSMAGTDVIIHLACLPLGQSARGPVQATRVNTEGTIQILEAARRGGTGRFVFTSTGQVYGGEAPLPNVESNPPQPDSAYAVSKLAAEMWCQTYARKYGFPVQILRLFNVYGAAVDGKPRPSVETIFLQQIRQGQRPCVRGNLQSGRDFVSIRDVIRAMLLALESPPWDGALNIGTGTLTTIETLAHLAAQVCGKSIEPEIVPDDGPAVRFQADTTRAQTLLGFRAEVKIKDGLKELADKL